MVDGRTAEGLMMIDVTESNEKEVIFALREYYRENFQNGDSDDSFLLWIDGMLAEGVEDEL